MKKISKYPVLLISTVSYVIATFIIPTDIPYDSLIGVVTMILGTILTFPYYLPSEMFKSMENSIPFQSFIEVLLGVLIAFSMDTCIHGVRSVVNRTKSPEEDA